ncbi:helix-turn-helix transcriptional regulator [Neolewinella aurantiaca]|uniref:Helix-turn-helix transcriptional regulator n=1 Tax=Neolewinella aurantiaca TaxID=2602767 RepID=A0A5C7FUE8_9BACT|nr:helix-turn-helix transcriptional regulator [Neolewinella aurantiaca]TXF90207.1 helix-turn-helix transcriptional regulator [Neolewinella aurantiaca]
MAENNIHYPEGSLLARKDKKLSQTQLAKQLSTSIFVISRYERGEMTPSIDNAKKLAGLLDTTVGYLLGETSDRDLLKDPAMLRRLIAISELPEKERDHVLYNLDAVIRDYKTRMAYAAG